MKVAPHKSNPQGTVASDLDDHARGRSRRLSSAILSGFVGRGLTLLAPFLVMPSMLRYLGEAKFGVWMTSVAITSMALFSDLGIGNGLLTRLSRAFGQGDRASMRIDIASAYASLTVVAATLLSLTWIVLLGINEGIIPVAGLRDPAVLSIVGASVGAFLLGVPASVIQRVMYACQQVWLSSVWQIVGAGASVVACLLAIWWELPPWAVILAYSIPPVGALILSAVVYFWTYTDLRPSLSYVRVDSVRELLALGSRFLLLSILTTSALNVDNVIIAAKAGAEAVTTYAVPARLGSLMGLMITTIYLPLWAANGEALARGDFEWVRTNTRRMTVYGSCSVALAGLLLVSFGDTLIMVWMHRSFEGQNVVLALIATLSIVMAVASPFQMTLNSLGATRPQVTAWAAFLAVTIAAKLLFVTPGSVWVAPLVSALGYALIILPAMYFPTVNLTNRWAKQ